MHHHHAPGPQLTGDFPDALPRARAKSPRCWSTMNVAGCSLRAAMGLFYRGASIQSAGWNSLVQKPIDL